MMETKKINKETKKYIALLVVSQIIIAFFIKIVNLRIAEILASILAIIILITLLYKIITNNNQDFNE